MPFVIGSLVGPRDPWFYLMIGAYFAWILIGTPTIFIAWARGVDTQKSEMLEGYTTLQGVFQNAEQRDPKTGVVIREAGSPFLTGQEFRVARLRAGEQHHD